MAERRNTPQKEAIARTLVEMGCHPTAAAVCEAVRRSYPTISRSTVYRVLGQMVREGTALRLGSPGGDDRYDGTTSPHSHIWCRVCGAVADVPAVAVAWPEYAGGFLVEEGSVSYRGVCPACRDALSRKE